LVLAACHADGDATLLAEVKAVLAARESRLQAWAFDARAGDDLYSVTFRAPRSTRLDSPGGALSFDGARFYERDDAAQTFTTYTPQLDAEKLALVWHQSFGVRVPEGFRPPLLPPRGVAARRQGDTVELTLRTTDDGKDVTVTSVLRWPSGDFLERRTDYGGVKGLVRMDQEHCDAALKLCVPVRLSTWAGDTQRAQTELTHVRLNDPPARDAFVLAAPQGFRQEHSTLVPTR
jgi:hypothetical protein